MSGRGWSAVSLASWAVIVAIAHGLARSQTPAPVAAVRNLSPVWDNKEDRKRARCLHQRKPNA